MLGCCGGPGNKKSSARSAGAVRRSFRSFVKLPVADNYRRGSYLNGDNGVNRNSVELGNFQSAWQLLVFGDCFLDVRWLLSVQVSAP